MNRYISKSYTTSKNTIHRQYTERGLVSTITSIIKIVYLFIIQSSTFHWKKKFVVSKLQTRPAEIFQKIQIWESELISKG